MVVRCSAPDCLNFTFEEYCFLHTSLNILNNVVARPQSPVRGIIPVNKLIPTIEPIKINTVAQICPICTDNEISGDELKKWSTAGHIGHGICQSCLSNLENTLCPICRLPLDHKLVEVGLLTDEIYAAILSKDEVNKYKHQLNDNWKLDISSYAFTNGIKININNIYNEETPLDYTLESRKDFIVKNRYVKPPPGWDQYYNKLTLEVSEDNYEIASPLQNTHYLNDFDASPDNNRQITQEVLPIPQLNTNPPIIEPVNTNIAPIHTPPRIPKALIQNVPRIPNIPSRQPLLLPQSRRVLFPSQLPQHQPPLPQHQPPLPQHQPPLPQHQPPLPQHQPPLPQHQPIIIPVKPTIIPVKPTIIPVKQLGVNPINHIPIINPKIRTLPTVPIINVITATPPPRAASPLTTINKLKPIPLVIPTLQIRSINKK
jgi:hypothetical protein